jgi:hypothetical protein
MAAPKPFTVVLILAVFACLALYVLGVGLGAQQGSSGGLSLDVKAQRARLRERFGKAPAVKDSELKAAGCALSERTARLAQGQTCQVDIAEAGTRLRRLELEPLAGSQVTVRLEPKGGPAVPSTLKSVSKRRELEVPGEGAVLRLTCTLPVSGACTVRL